VPVIHAQVDAGLAEEAHPGAAGAEKQELDARIAPRQQSSQQILALAAVDAAEHQHAQPVARRRLNGLDRHRPGCHPMRDQVPGQVRQARLDAGEVGVDAATGAEQRGARGQQRGDVVFAQPTPGRRAGFRELEAIVGVVQRRVQRAG